MTHDELVTLSFAELRDRLKAGAEQLSCNNDIDLMEAQRYLTALPDLARTPDSVEALIWLARDFFFAARPEESVHAASLASRLAISIEQKLLLCEARGLEGLALTDLGRFTESTVAHAESWRLARALGEIEREISTIKRVGGLWSAMAI